MIACLSDKMNLEYNQQVLESKGILFSRESTDILAYKKDKLFKFQTVRTDYGNLGVYKDLSWFELFVKLDFEYFLKYFRHLQNLDFGKYIKYLNATKGHLKGLFLNLYESGFLKSGSYWI